MNEQNLKRALFGAVVLCLLLASALAYIFVEKRGSAHAQEAADPVVASGPDTVAGGGTASPAAAAPGHPALAPVQLSPQRMQEIGVTTAVAEMKNASSDVEAPGSVAINEQNISYVQTRFAGWIRNVYARATYQYVKKGQRLFTIYSPDLVGTEQEFLLARQNQQTSSGHMHGTAAEEGNWLLQAAEDRLRRFDIPESEIAAMKQSGVPQREIAIESPASGYIIERNALPNAYVQPDTKLYTIADLSTVWVYANVAQVDVGRLKPGNPADVTVDAYPGRKFGGRVDQILPDVDPATRTVRVRLAFRNPGVVLKPGMYVGVKISAPLGAHLVIPASAVLQSGTRAIAYLDHGNGSLEPREIEIGPRLDDSVVVLKGLKAGDRVVSSANFLVDSEAQLQAAMGGPAPGQPPVSSSQQAQEPITIDLDTVPSPAHRGANKVRVKLTENGKPLSGAEVNATFFMPAMPAMGMAAMRSVARLADRGNGNYEGPLQLDSGGTWQVTVAVTRNGQIIATKQLSVDATGGM